MLHPAIVVRQAGAVHASGLFAEELIPEGTVVWTLQDPTYTWEEIQSWSIEKRRYFKWYGFQCGVNRYAVPYDDSREANHSCRPNMLWLGSDSLVSRWDVQPGEELTYDYASSDITLPMEFRCDCGVKGCRKQITHLDYLHPDWQEQYGENLPPHVLEAISRARRV
jgi:hypothetical protein